MKILIQANLYNLFQVHRASLLHYITSRSPSHWIDNYKNEIMSKHLSTSIYMWTTFSRSCYIQLLVQCVFQCNSIFWDPKIRNQVFLYFSFCENGNTWNKMGKYFWLKKMDADEKEKKICDWGNWVFFLFICLFCFILFLSLLKQQGNTF